MTSYARDHSRRPCASRNSRFRVRPSPQDAGRQDGAPASSPPGAEAPTTYIARLLPPARDQP